MAYELDKDAREKRANNAFQLYCLGLSSVEIGRRVGLSATQVCRLANARGWKEQREDIFKIRNRKIGLEALKEQESVKGIELQLHRDLIAAGTLALENFCTEPYEDKSGKKHPTAKEITDLIDLGTKLGRLAVGLPLQSQQLDVGVRHDLGESIRAALAKAYPDPPKLAQVTPIEINDSEKDVSE
jgi:hypothetical protein